MQDSNITDNSITNSGENGMYALDCNNLLIDSNLVNDSYYAGIYIEGESGEHYLDSTITNNNITFNANDCDSGCGGIEMYYEDNCLIQDNTVSDSGYNGISLFECKENDILSNTVERNDNYGIRIASRNAGDGANNTIDGNILLNNSNAGIRIATEDNTVTDNTVTGDNNNDEIGIYIYSERIDPTRNYFARNNVSNYYDGIEIYYSTNSSFVDNNVFENLADGFYIYETENTRISGGEIYNNNYDWGDYGGVYVYDSFNFTLEDAYLYNNTDMGAYLYYSDNFTIANCDVLNSTDYGVYIYESYDGIMRDSNISGSVEDIGFYADDSSATIYSSDFENNGGEGLYAYESNITVYNSDFEDNGNEYGIYDENSTSDNINWIVDTVVYCTNNNVSIWGSLTFEGAGRIVADNCNVWVHGILTNGVPVVEEEEDQSNPGSGSSGGLPPQQGQTMQINITSVQGATETLKVGDIVTFEVNSEKHTGTIMSLSTDYIVIWFSSEKVSVTLQASETKQVDLDADGINDISVYLDRIELGKATVTFATIGTPKEVMTAVATQANEAAVAEVQQAAAQPIVSLSGPGISTWTVLIGTMAVIAVAAVIWHKTRK